MDKDQKKEDLKLELTEIEKEILVLFDCFNRKRTHERLGRVTSNGWACRFSILTTISKTLFGCSYGNAQ